MGKRLLLGIAAIGLVIGLAAGVLVWQLPAIGAGALLFPTRHVNSRPKPAGCVDRQFAVNDVSLDSWWCTGTAARRRGTIIYLHGIADNRGSASGVIERFVPAGYDVLAYDSRAHGTSSGEHCTYGYFEKRDLMQVIDQVGASDVVLVGHSLGAAVALQAAAIDPRVRAVVAASAFSDLRTIASERAPFPAWSLAPAFARAERDGQFVVDDVSPAQAAGQINVPVLLIHGAEDRETRPSHSRRVFDRLSEPKKLMIVSRASHNDVLGAQVWNAIADWLDLHTGR